MKENKKYHIAAMLAGAAVALVYGVEKIAITADLPAGFIGLAASLLMAFGAYRIHSGICGISEKKSLPFLIIGYLVILAGVPADSVSVMAIGIVCLAIWLFRLVPDKKKDGEQGL